jgi:hypothetical protein
MKTCEYCGDELIRGVNIMEFPQENICDLCWDDIMEGTIERAKNDQDKDIR